MLGNRALQAGIANVTATGNTTLGYASGNTIPVDLVTVSASGAATIVLPTIAVGSTTLGIGDKQLIRVVNLNSQSVALAANSANVIVGATGTIASGSAATLISDAANTRWVRF